MSSSNKGSPTVHSRVDVATTKVENKKPLNVDRFIKKKKVQLTGIERINKIYHEKEPESFDVSQSLKIRKS